MAKKKVKALKSEIKSRKKTIAKQTQTRVIAISKGHSSSAYSLDELKPASNDSPPKRIAICQAQQVNHARPGAKSRTWLVRCTL